MAIVDAHMLGDGLFHGRMPLRVFNFRQADDIWHWHDFHELVVVRRGSGVHETDAGNYVIGRGDVFLLLPGTVHTYRNSNGLEIANLIYRPDRLELPLADLPETEGFRRFFRFTEKARPAAGKYNRKRLSDGELHEAEGILGRMLIEQQHCEPGQEFYLKLLLLELIRLICRSYEKVPGKSADECGRLARVVDYMERKCTEPLTLAQLAAVGGRSPCTLNRMFRGALGCSPIEFLIELRLERGAAQLRDTDDRIIEIAMRCGFCDSNYFTKLFTRKYGCSPRDYRRSRR